MDFRETFMFYLFFHIFIVFVTLSHTAETKSIRFLEKTKLVHPLDLKHVRKKNLNATDTRLLRENKIKNNNNFFKFFQQINSGSKYDMPDNSYKDFSSEKVDFSADRIDPADSHISHSSLRRLLTLIRTSSRVVRERNGCSNCDINENVRKRRDVPVSTGRPPDVHDITEGGLAEETKHMLVKHQTTQICDCGTNKKNISLGFKRTRSRDTDASWALVCTVLLTSLLLVVVAHSRMWRRRDMWPTSTEGVNTDPLTGATAMTAQIHIKDLVKSKMHSLKQMLDKKTVGKYSVLPQHDDERDADSDDNDVHQV